MKLTDLKFTPGPWYPVDYAGYIDLQTTPRYICNRSILDKDHDVLAENNGFLASKAPDLIAALVEARDVMQAFDMKSDKVNEVLDKINKLLES